MWLHDLVEASGKGDFYRMEAIMNEYSKSFNLQKMNPSELKLPDGEHEQFHEQLISDVIMDDSHKAYFLQHVDSLIVNVLVISALIEDEQQMFFSNVALTFCTIRQLIFLNMENTEKQKQIFSIYHYLQNKKRTATTGDDIAEDDITEDDINEATEYECKSLGKMRAIEEKDKEILKKYIQEINNYHEYSNAMILKAKEKEKEINITSFPAMFYFGWMRHEINEKIALFEQRVTDEGENSILKRVLGSKENTTGLYHLKKLIDEKISQLKVSKEDLNEIKNEFNNSVIEPINQDIDEDNRKINNFISEIYQWATSVLDTLKTVFSVGKVSTQRVVTDSVASMHSCMWSVNRNFKNLPADKNALVGQLKNPDQFKGYRPHGR